MRLRLLLPFLMFALAALACDGGISYNTIYVAAVDADAEQPGHVRVIVREIVGFIANQMSESTPLRETDTYFASTDYGQTWTLTDAFDAPTGSIDISEQGYSALFGGESWSFPRQGFRDFFYDRTSSDTGDSIDYFVVGQGGYHNRIAGDAIYISMGTEGILVGPAPGVETTRPWELRQNIPGLRPLPLGFSDPLTVAWIVLAALLLPPLPFIHAYLLSRVWRYLMPASDAWRRALRLSLAFAALAAAAIVLWVVPTMFDIGFYPMAVAVGSIVIVVSIIMTVHHARTARLAPRDVRRAGIAAAVVASFVPLGVLAVWWAWWLVALLVFGYMAMWWVANGHLRRNGIVTDPAKAIMHWWTDRLALGGLFLCGVSAALVGIPLRAFSSLASYQLQDAITILLTIVIIATCALTLRWHMDRQASVLQTDIQSVGWVKPALSVVGWLAATGVVSIAVLVGQLSIAGWFHSLMTP